MKLHNFLHKWPGTISLKIKSLLPAYLEKHRLCVRKSSVVWWQEGIWAFSLSSQSCLLESETLFQENDKRGTEQHTQYLPLVFVFTSHTQTHTQQRKIFFKLHKHIWMLWILPLPLEKPWDFKQIILLLSFSESFFF